MAANRPMMVSPAPICKGVPAKVVIAELAPMPRKKTTIMPSRLHLSASHPAGMAPTPKATKPGAA